MIASSDALESPSKERGLTAIKEIQAAFSSTSDF